MLTSKEREACSDLFYIFSEERIEPHQWNEKAAFLLYEMIAKIKKCSAGMNWLPTIATAMPTSGSAAATYLLKYVYKSVKAHIQLKKITAVVVPCQQVGVGVYKTDIYMAVMGL